uniref:Uncharacterized protein n=1 Tax=Cacopsylla melanoneura TaxID=428564 RepID=A0A8D9AHM4_9HEMI
MLNRINRSRLYISPLQLGLPCCSRTACYFSISIVLNKGQEYEDLIDKYRAQFNEKNAEISRLQNTQCDACAKRRNEVKSGDTTNGGGTIEELKKEVAHLRQVNKGLGALPLSHLGCHSVSLRFLFNLLHIQKNH